ncbi:MAG TPA: hypothetical protein VF898_07685 [Chloroflexota bacterium]
MNYQNALRAIGEWIDARHPRSIRIIELPDGYSLQWQWPNAPTMYQRNFLLDELVALQRRSHRQPPSFDSTGLNGSLDYQATNRNVLRAIGYEMDQVNARQLLVEQVDDSYLITYEYQNVREGTSWRKYMSVMTAQQRHNLLIEARGRRQRKTGLAARMG